MQHQTQIITASRELAAVPGVREVRAGRVVKGQRAVVEDSYDVALMLRFDDEAALAAYIEHPLHKALVRQHIAPLMARYQVMDFAQP